MDKILYTGGPNPFKGLMGMPEDPRKKNYKPLSEFNQDMVKYREQVESLKSNAPDIVNPEILPTFPKPHIDGWILPKNLKPGMIFDLPVGYEFKEQYQVSFDGINWFDCKIEELGTFLTQGEHTRTVLRIVKVEVKSEVEEKLYYKCSKCGQTASEECGILCTYPMPMRTSGICAGSIDAIISEEEYRKFGSQPEPVESQTELWDEAANIVYYSVTRGEQNGECLNELQDKFVIHRKK